MPSTKPLERYLNAGIAATQLTRQKAEDIVRDLMSEGEAGREAVEEWVEDLFVRSRRFAEQLTRMVGDEIRRQVDQLGLVRRDDVGALVERVVNAARSAGQRSVREAIHGTPTAPTPSDTRVAAGRGGRPRTQPQSPRGTGPSSKRAPAASKTAKKRAATPTPASRSDSRRSTKKPSPPRTKKTAGTAATAKKRAGTAQATAAKSAGGTRKSAGTAARKASSSSKKTSSAAATRTTGAPRKTTAAANKSGRSTAVRASRATKKTAR